jgi:branched-chain amino acid transport system permease protein
MTDLPPQGPQIGADEWVARADERFVAHTGLRGAVERAVERVHPAIRFGVIVTAAGVFGIATSDQYYQRVGFNTLYYAVLALGLNVVVGWAGLLDLGYVAFFGIGAYTYAFLDSPQYHHHWPPLATMAIATVGCAIVGLFVGLPSRRLLGDYLAIVTLFFGQIFYNVVGNLSITNGPNGMINLDPLRFFGYRITSVRQYYYVALVLFVFVVVVLWLVNHSRTGRAWRSLREDPLAAQLLGMPINPLKLLAFSFGAGVAGLTGVLFAALEVNIFPSNFYLDVLITLYAIVVLGGAGSMAGAMLGAFSITVGIEILNSTGNSPTLFYLSASRLFYIGMAVALVLWLRPWRWFVAVVGATIGLGFAFNAIVTAAWPSGTHPQSGSYQSGFVSGWMVELTSPTHIGNFAYVALIGAVLGLTLVKGWIRKALLVPLIYLAAFVWENELVLNPSVTALIMLGALLVALMVVRPSGLLGTSRVEIV